MESIKGIDPWITCTWSVDSWSSTPPAHSQAGLPTGRPEDYRQERRIRALLSSRPWISGLCRQSLGLPRRVSAGLYSRFVQIAQIIIICANYSRFSKKKRRSARRPRWEPSAVRANHQNNCNLREPFALFEEKKTICAKAPTEATSGSRKSPIIPESAVL